MAPRISVAALAASLCLLTSVLAIPAAAPAAPSSTTTPAGEFTFYQLPQPVSGPCDLDTAPDGSIWSSNFLSNTVARVDTKTGEVTEYEIPYTLLPEVPLAPLKGLESVNSFACVMRTGSNGLLYAASGFRNQLVEINPDTKAIKVYTPTPYNPLGNLQPFNDAWTGPEGMFFSQTTGNVVTYFHYESKTFTNYEVPTPLGGPLGMRTAKDGALWFTEFTAVPSKIARLNYTSGHIDEFALPASLLGAAVMRVEYGDKLYFGGALGNSIGSFNIYTHEIESFPAALPLSVPAENSQDPFGNVWYTSLDGFNDLFVLDPATGENTIIPLPNTIAPVEGIAIAVHYDQGTNAMWFTETALNYIGKLQLPCPKVGPKN